MLQRHDAIDANVRIRPAPERVLSLVESHGMPAAVERWSWIRREGLAKLAAKGREDRRAMAGEVLPCRRTTPAEEEATIKAVYRLGSVHAAAIETGRPYTTIMTYLRERGIRDYPKVSHSERGRRAWQTRLARGNTGASA
jgi:hypothetical protein